MKKLIAIALAVVLVLALAATPVFAGIGKDIKDMGGDKGAHYNLNIIGVQHDKTVPDMTGSNRHTIFVRLGEDGTPEHVDIYVMRNPIDNTQFQVWDGNATDDGEATIYVPYEDYGTLSYNVYAIALGKFGGKADVIASVTFEAGTTGSLLMGDFELKREKVDGKGKPKVVNISDIFRATGVIDVAPAGPGPEDITFTNVWVFNVPTLLEYLWDYSNEGLKLMQVRFYETTSGSWTNVPD